MNNNESSGPATGATASSGASRGYEKFVFTGSGGEYFRIWIVNLLLSIVTLGIYSAWAKVRRLRYFYGNTQLAGSSFEYHGDPLKILKGRIIACLLIVPYYVASNFSPLLAIVFALLFLIALPFIVVKSRMFQTRMSSWRNIRFDFVGTYGQAAGIYIGLAILIPFTLGLIIPYTIYARQRFLLNEAKYGSTQARFGATPGQYYMAYLIALGIGVVTIIVGAIITAVVTGTGLLKIVQSMQTETDIAGVIGPLLLMYAIIIIGYLYAYAVVQSRITNAAFGDLQIGEHRLKSQLQPWPLAGIYLSNAILMAVTLGLFMPWAKVRLVRYQLQSMQLETHGSLDAFVAEESKSITATGSEVGDLLDLDFGL